jgi:glycosyltransferase involved in cell wall biosynthesis
MEAMAAGLLVVTSDLGALPETTMGAAVIVAGPKKAEDVPEFARVYRDAFIATMHAIGRDPQKFWQARWDQVRAMNTRFTWPVRAAEWEALFTTL